MDFYQLSLWNILIWSLIMNSQKPAKQSEDLEQFAHWVSWWKSLGHRRCKARQWPILPCGPGSWCAMPRRVPLQGGSFTLELVWVPDTCLEVLQFGGGELPCLVNQLINSSSSALWGCMPGSPANSLRSHCWSRCLAGCQLMNSSSGSLLELHARKLCKFSSLLIYLMIVEVLNEQKQTASLILVHLMAQMTHLNKDD